MTATVGESGEGDWHSEGEKGCNPYTNVHSVLQQTSTPNVEPRPPPPPYSAFVGSMQTARMYAGEAVVDGPATFEIPYPFAAPEMLMHYRHVGLPGAGVAPSPSWCYVPMWTSTGELVWSYQPNLPPLGVVPRTSTLNLTSFPSSPFSSSTVVPPAFVAPPVGENAQSSVAPVVAAPVAVASSAGMAALAKGKTAKRSGEKFQKVLPVQCEVNKRVEKLVRQPKPHAKIGFRKIVVRPVESKRMDREASSSTISQGSTPTRSSRSTSSARSSSVTESVTSTSVSSQGMEKTKVIVGGVKSMDKAQGVPMKSMEKVKCDMKGQVKSVVVPDCVGRKCDCPL